MCGNLLSIRLKTAILIHGIVQENGGVTSDEPNDEVAKRMQIESSLARLISPMACSLRCPCHPEAKLAKKSAGKEVRMSFSAHVLMENRNGLCMDISVAEANGKAECEEALKLVRREKARGSQVKTLGADKGYDNQTFVPALKAEGITPHIAAKKYTAMDGRTLRSKGYSISQRCRKKVEEIFGWMKTVGGFRKTRYKGVNRTGLCAYLVGAAYNLVRMSKLMVA